MIRKGKGRGEWDKLDYHLQHVGANCLLLYQKEKVVHQPTPKAKQ